jgi:cyclic-di-GMP-binding protein
MAKSHSYDIASEVDLQEVSNAIEQTKKEIATRYDFKDSKSSVDFDKGEKKISLHTESDFRLKSVTDILHTRCVKRGVSLKALEPQEVERAVGGTVRQTITIRQGISTEKAKEIVKFIKQSKLKVQAQIQEQKIRVQSAKIDTLQESIQLVKGQNFDIDLQFSNYR